MKKTVTVKTYRTETVEVEVEFPIYRYQDDAPDMGYPDELFERTDADGTTWSIHRRDCRRYDKDADGVGTTYKVLIENMELGGEDMDYALGRGQYSLKEEEFYEMLARARRFLDGFPQKTTT